MRNSPTISPRAQSFVDGALVEVAAAARAAEKEAKAERAKMADCIIDLLLERAAVRRTCYRIIDTTDPGPFLPPGFVGVKRETLAELLMLLEGSK